MRPIDNKIGNTIRISKCLIFSLNALSRVLSDEFLVLLDSSALVTISSDSGSQSSGKGSKSEKKHARKKGKKRTDRLDNYNARSAEKHGIQKRLVYMRRVKVIKVSWWECRYCRLLC